MIKNIISIKSKNFQYFVAFIIAISIGIYFRLYPITKYALGNDEEKATILVLSQLRNQVNAEINAKSPEMPAYQKEILSKKLFNELLSKNKDKIRDSISIVSKKIENQVVDDNKKYLLASDSFYYYSLTNNLLKTGKIANKVKGSKYLNELMLAPLGHWEPLNFHPILGAITYKTLKIFLPDITVMSAISYTPLFLTFFTLLAFFLICTFLEIRPLLSFIGAVFFILAGIFVKRSTFAWYDNDAYNIFFPLIITWTFLSGIKFLGNERKSLIYALLTSVLFVCYAVFWHGWGLLLSILIASGIATLFSYFFILKDKLEAKKISIYLAILLFSCILFIGFAFGLKEFFTLFKEGWIALKNFMQPQLSLWPDLYISVGELHRSSLAEVIRSSGGIFCFSVAVFGILSSLYIFFKNKDKKIVYSITFLVSFIVTLFIALKAKRFALLSVAPIAFAFLAGLQNIFNIFSACIDNKISKEPLRKLSHLVLSLFLLLSILLPISYIHKNLRGLLNPIYNEVWDKTLIKIRDNTPKESIINTWWPPGHFIKAIAERRVTFDGATINVPQAYWMANVFLSQSEEEALGILRMLNNSANKAAEYLQSLNIDLSDAIPMLKEITKMDRTRAEITLNTLLGNKSQVKQVLELTHKTPPPSYLLLYNEFVDNNIQLKFIGNWNFKAIESINKNKSLLKEVPHHNSPQYIQFLWKLAGGQFRYSAPLPQVGQYESFALFQDNIKIDLNSKNAYIQSQTFGKGIPYSVFYLEGNEIKEKVLDNSSLTFSIVLVRNDRNYTCMLMDRPLANSLLIKLYLFDGIGQKYFKLFSKETDLTKRTEIEVFEIDWKKFEEDSSRRY